MAVSNGKKVIEFLRDNLGVLFTTDEIAKGTGLTVAQIRSTMSTILLEQNIFTMMIRSKPNVGNTHLGFAYDRERQRNDRLRNPALWPVPSTLKNGKILSENPQNNNGRMRPAA